MRFRRLVSRKKGPVSQKVVPRDTATSLTTQEHTEEVTKLVTELSSTPATEPDKDQISEDLWSRAYRTLSEREPDLVADYERHIQMRQDDNVDASDLSSACTTQRLSSQKAVKETLEALQNERERKQWKFTIRSKDHKVKDQLEKLVKLLTLADGLVKQAASAQPYAALAWSAASIFLPVS